MRVTTTTKSKTPPPPYSFDNSVPAPKLVNTGEPRAEVVASLIAYSDWMAGHQPDAALTANVAAEGSTSFTKVANNMRELKANERRLYEVKSAPDEISIVSSTPTSMTARIIQHLTSQRVVDPNGRVRIERPVDGPTVYIGLFVRSDDAWLLASLDEHS